MFTTKVVAVDKTKIARSKPFQAHHIIAKFAPHLWRDHHVREGRQGAQHAHAVEAGVLPVLRQVQRVPRPERVAEAAREALDHRGPAREHHVRGHLVPQVLVRRGDAVEHEGPQVRLAAEELLREPQQPLLVEHDVVALRVGEQEAVGQLVEHLVLARELARVVGEERLLDRGDEVRVLVELLVVGLDLLHELRGEVLAREDVLPERMLEQEALVHRARLLVRVAHLEHEPRERSGAVHGQHERVEHEEALHVELLEHDARDLRDVLARRLAVAGAEDPHVRGVQPQLVVDAEAREVVEVVEVVHERAAHDRVRLQQLLLVRQLVPVELRVRVQPGLHALVARLAVDGRQHSARFVVAGQPQARLRAPHVDQDRLHFAAVWGGTESSGSPIVGPRDGRVLRDVALDLLDAARPPPEKLYQEVDAPARDPRDGHPQHHEAEDRAPAQPAGAGRAPVHEGVVVVRNDAVHVQPHIVARPHRLEAQLRHAGLAVAQLALLVAPAAVEPHVRQDEAPLPRCRHLLHGPEPHRLDQHRAVVDAGVQDPELAVHAVATAVHAAAARAQQRVLHARHDLLDDLALGQLDPPRCVHDVGRGALDAELSVAVEPEGVQVVPLVAQEDVVGAHEDGGRPQLLALVREGYARGHVVRGLLQVAARAVEAAPEHVDVVVVREDVARAALDRDGARLLVRAEVLVADLAEKLLLVAAAELAIEARAEGVHAVVVADRHGHRLAAVRVAHADALVHEVLHRDGPVVHGVLVRVPELLVQVAAPSVEHAVCVGEEDVLLAQVQPVELPAGVELDLQVNGRLVHVLRLHAYPQLAVGVGAGRVEPVGGQRAARRDHRGWPTPMRRLGIEHDLTQTQQIEHLASKAQQHRRVRENAERQLAASAHIEGPACGPDGAPLSYEVENMLSSEQASFDYGLLHSAATTTGLAAGSRNSSTDETPFTPIQPGCRAGSGVLE